MLLSVRKHAARSTALLTVTQASGPGSLKISPQTEQQMCTTSVCQW